MPRGKVSTPTTATHPRAAGWSRSLFDALQRLIPEVMTQAHNDQLVLDRPMLAADGRPYDFDVDLFLYNSDDAGQSPLDTANARTIAI